MRLIDADALMQTLGITDMDCVRCAWYSKAYRQCKRGGDFEDACCAIEDAPTIEAVPERKKGRWVQMKDEKTNSWWWECSECGKYPLKSVFHRYDELSKYCPHCGASMMKGAEDAGRSDE